MTNKNIVKNIQSIVRTGNYIDTEIFSVLNAHGCNYILQKIFPSHEIKLKHFINEVTITERYRHIFPVISSLDSIKYAIIKGAVLSDRIYKSPFVRESGDVDILVERNNTCYIKQSLTSNGFVQGRVENGKIIPFSRDEIVFHLTQSHQTAPFVKPTSNSLCPFISVDINTSVFWGEYEGNHKTDRVLNETEDYELFGKKVKILSPEMEFISMCLHHYKDMNSIYLLSLGNISLEHFFDIFFYLKNVKMSMSKLIRLTDIFSAKPYIYYCLWHTNHILDEPMITKLLPIFKTTLGVNLISSFGLSSNERYPWEIDFFDRLFSDEFKKEFNKTLNIQQQDKIQINSRFIR